MNQVRVLKPVGVLMVSRIALQVARKIAPCDRAFSA